MRHFTALRFACNSIAGLCFGFRSAGRIPGARHATMFRAPPRQRVAGSRSVRILLPRTGFQESVEPVPRPAGGRGAQERAGGLFAGRDCRWR